MVTCLALTLTVSVVACSDDSAPPPDPASVAAASSASASQQALFEEAKKVHDALWKLNETLSAQGGADSTPPEMLEYTMGIYTEYDMALLRDQWVSKRWTKPGTAPTYVGPVPYAGETKSGMEEATAESAIIIESCIDGRNSPLVDEAGNRYLREIGYNVSYMKWDADGKLKFFESWTDPVTTCPVHV